ncbi:MAG: MotA/TolQ/ExbB proton channel family protein [Telmatospirillum sp.]|nr:MotA/TolQ/ExbB proton channel family protein [Telmatospirillum sp.]
MTFNMELLHTAIFYVLYIATAGATFVVVERMIFYWVSLRDARRLEAVLTPETQHVRDLPADLVERDSLPAEAVRRMLEAKPQLAERSDMEDFAESLFIAAKAKLHRHIWVLDTIVTAAPLLGLLGTILGIIDTFAALATSGTSDPAAVSQGIGTALYATALGISVALYGLFFHNLFQVRITAINDHVKILLLRAGIGQDEAALPGARRAIA